MCFVNFPCLCVCTFLINHVCDSYPYLCVLVSFSSYLCVCVCLQLPKIDEQQILEGIPEETKRDLQQKIWDRNKQSRRPVKPGHRVPSSKPLIRRSSVVLPDTTPKSPGHVVSWFREREAPRGHCRERDGTVSIWFHGESTLGGITHYAIVMM